MSALENLMRFFGCISARKRRRRSVVGVGARIHRQYEALESRQLLSIDVQLLADINPNGSSLDRGTLEFRSVGSYVYFAANDGTRGLELWRTDGSSSGTSLVSDIYPGAQSSSPTFLVNVDGTLFFRANDGVHGDELWRSDGTCTGTTLVRDIYPPSPFGIIGSSPVALTNVSGTLFFSANDTVHGHELWRSNGTSSGTQMVRDINAGVGSSNPLILTNVNGTLFFAGEASPYGREVWRSDGTSAGTTVLDILPGPTGSFPEPYNLNGQLFIAANNQLLRSDGTSSGTTLVSSLSSTPRFLTNSGDAAYFSALDNVTPSGVELWKSNGASSGTSIVKDIHPGWPNSNPLYLTDVNGTLFFQAGDSVNGRSLWKTDGSDSGTELVKAFPFNSAPRNLVNVNGVLYFSANHGAFFNDELWRSDGTCSGTNLVREIAPGIGASNPQVLSNLNGVLYLVADDNAHGFEPWVSREVDQTLAVVNLDSRAVVTINEQGQAETLADSDDGLFTPVGASYNAEGDLLVSDVLAGTTGSVSRFDPAGVKSPFAGMSQGLIAPTGMAHDAGGNLYVANYFGNTITKITPAGVGSVFADATDGVSRPFDVAVDAGTGTVYVANLDARQVLKFTAAGIVTVFADAADGLFSPIGVAVDFAGNVFVSDVLLSRVTKFMPSGVGTVYADSADGITSPVGMAFDTDGNLYVANYLSDTVISVAPDGVGSVFTDSGDGIDRPFDVAFGLLPAVAPIAASVDSEDSKATGQIAVVLGRTVDSRHFVPATSFVTSRTAAIDEIHSQDRIHWALYCLALDLWRQSDDD